MWDMRSTMYEKERMALLDEGWEPFAVTEHNIDGYGHQTSAYYFRRQVEPKVRYTPEAQKVQDEAKLAGSIVHVPFGLAPLDNHQIAALQKDREETRAQAIKDVAKYLKEYCFGGGKCVTKGDLRSFSEGKIPE